MSNLCSSIRIGTRSSALARWQADWVSDQLRALDIVVELIEISTTGDLQQTGPIGKIGTQGVFTKEIQNALLQDRIDLAVHSLKDLPTEPVPGLILTAVPQRGPIGDVLVSRKHDSFNQLPPSAIVATGSMRRRAQLLSARNDLTIVDLRGNVDTRLRKLEQGQYDAIILAEAGLRRLNLEQHITELLSTEMMLPAVGQGALGLETRENDTNTRNLLEPLCDANTFAAVSAERSLLFTLRGGCLAPVGALGQVTDSSQLHLQAVVLSVDGKQKVSAEQTGLPEDAIKIGEHVAQQLIDQGAQQLIQESRDLMDK